LIILKFTVAPEAEAQDRLIFEERNLNQGVAPMEVMAAEEGILFLEVMIRCGLFYI